MKKKEYKHSHHRHQGRVEDEAFPEVPLQEFDYGSLQATSGTINTHCLLEGAWLQVRFKTLDQFIQHIITAF